MKVNVHKGESVVGGGSTPGQSLPTSLVAVSHPKLSAQALESELRLNDPPIIARIDRDQLVMDLRTVLAGQEEKIVEALGRIAGKFGDDART
jgi:L-seryl-tRNA(Ser) seleniumtransferase